MQSELETICGWCPRTGINPYERIAKRKIIGMHEVLTTGKMSPICKRCHDKMKRNMWYSLLKMKFEQIETGGI